MSELVERARSFAQWGLYGGEPVDRSDFTAWADHIEELERERDSWKAANLAQEEERRAERARMEEMGQALREIAATGKNKCSMIATSALARLEKGKQEEGR